MVHTKSIKEKVVFVNHLTCDETSELEDSTSDDETEPAPSTFEEGGQATVDNLK